MLTVDIFTDIDASVSQQLKSILDSNPDDHEVTLNISSYGGSIFDAISMIDLLRPYQSTCNIIGYACSASAILALSCNHINISPLGSIMIHSAWSDTSSSQDPGIVRANDIQLSIIRKRNPLLNETLFIKDNWFSATQALNLHLVDSIIDSSDKVLALSNKYLAHFNSISCKGECTMDEIKVNETLEQIEPQCESLSTENPEPKEPEQEKHDVIEVIEKLVERVNELESRLKALEEPISDPSPVVEESQDDRISSLYNSLCKPKASLGISPVSKVEVRKVRDDFKKYTNI